MNGGASSGLLSSSTATIIAGIFGFLGGVFSRVGKHWYEKRIKRVKFRRAILTEIKSPRSTINDIENQSASDVVEFTHAVFPNKIYNEQIENVGLLSSAEVGQVVDYYTIAEVADEQLDALAEEENGVDADHFMNETIPNLKDARYDAEKILQYHTKFLGKFRYKLRRGICGDFLIG